MSDPTYTVAIGLLAFGLFITAVLVGLRWIIRQDTNRNDTALSLQIALAIADLKLLTSQLTSLGRAAREATSVCNNFARVFSKALTR